MALRIGADFYQTLEDQLSLWVLIAGILPIAIFVVVVVVVVVKFFNKNTLSDAK